MTTEILIIGAYGLILVLLAIFGFHRSLLVYLYFKHRKDVPKPAGTFHDLPRVTIQLPFFNEMYVVERLLDATAKIDYPRDRLDVQVLDDSTDETVEISRRKVAELQKAGLDISYHHRTDRTGFKAGALDQGLKSAKGEFVMIFDADFIPTRTIVMDTIHYFTDPKIAVVQARWAHLNRDQSALTRVQSLMLDGHFIMEHTARSRADRFFNFNGTAGIWRKSAIDDAGGWQHETLTEDMDLSYRAQLRGWKFIYLKDVVVPAELPAEMNAFKAQQFRWAKGSLQVGRKLLPTILRSNIPFHQKSEAFFHLINNVAYPLLLLLSLLLLPVLMLRTTHGWREVLLVDLPMFFGTTLSVCTFYLTTQREEGSRSVWWALGRLPLLLAMGIGLCVSQTRAVIEALMGKESEFVRTPKYGDLQKGGDWAKRKYRGSLGLVPFLELGMTAYFLVTLALAIQAGRYVSIPFVLLFLTGFGYVGLMSVIHALGQRRAARAAAQPTIATVEAAAPEPAPARRAPERIPAPWMVADRSGPVTRTEPQSLLR
jgi:cellulose synthase/poly-beta-1,6-N-acetylglucosamine synthase-like glycosyltransferase